MMQQQFAETDLNRCRTLYIMNHDYSRYDATTVCGN
jgi:hypothetical protein